MVTTIEKQIQKRWSMKSNEMKKKKRQKKLKIEYIQIDDGWIYIYIFLIWKKKKTETVSEKCPMKLSAFNTFIRSFVQ